MKIVNNKERGRSSRIGWRIEKKVAVLPIQVVFLPLSSSIVCVNNVMLT